MPVLIRIGGISIYTWGFMLALAFVAGIFVVRKELARKGIEQDLAFDLGIYALMGGLAGARLTYVAGHFSEYVKNPLLILALWQGGLVFYGGLVSGAIAVLAFIRRKKLNLARTADAIAPALAIGSAIGRLGCFTRGCCYGIPTSLPWGVTYTDVHSAAPLGIAVHPTQLYEFGYNVVIFGALWAFRKRASDDGFTFWLFLGLYGVFRFLVEFLRVRPIIALGLGGSQIFSLAIVVVSIGVLGLSHARAISRNKTAETERFKAGA